MNSEMDKICTTLDKLTLDSLTLMEKHIQSKIDLEKIMSEGENNLAKARYIMGQNNVSKLQLPTEDSKEFNALSMVNCNEHDDTIRTDHFDLETEKDVNDENSVNPLRWFGILVPQNLHVAQNKFKNAIYWAVQCANIQVQLDDTLNAIQKLQCIKKELMVEE